MKGNGKLPNVGPRQIDETTEYEVFKRIDGNRELKEGHVLEIMEAIRKKDLFVPILVNQDFKIIDGQHTYEARKRLGLPILYYWDVNLTLLDVQKLNSIQKSWTSDDYCHAYIELGYDDYKTYKWFRGHYGLPHKPAVGLLEGKYLYMGTLSQRFKDGEFKVRDLEGAKEKAEMIQQLSHLFEHWRDAGFISAFLTALGREGFVFKTLIHRMKSNPTLLRPCKTQDQYLAMIEDVYNYNARMKVPIRFGSDKDDRGNPNPPTFRTGPRRGADA